MFPLREQVRTAHWSTHDLMMLLWSKEILSPQVQQESKQTLLISKNALVMFTMNLWPSVGLCNGATGTVVDIIYTTLHILPDLPATVIVKVDNYIGSSISKEIPSLIAIAPMTSFYKKWQFIS